MNTEKIKQELLLRDSSGKIGIKFEKTRKIAGDSIVIVYKKIITEDDNFYMIKHCRTIEGQIVEIIDEKDMEILLNQLDADNYTIDKLKNHC